jgi:hypothetical protein
VAISPQYGKAMNDNTILHKEDTHHQMLARQLRQELGLADNALGNGVVEKIIQQSGVDSKKARYVIPQYKALIKSMYPDERDELIILDYLDDEDYHMSNKPSFDMPAKRNKLRNNVPRQIAYLVFTPYRPRLD